jgi:hypothetical protein
MLVIKQKKSFLTHRFFLNPEEFLCGGFGHEKGSEYEPGKPCANQTGREGKYRWAHWQLIRLRKGADVLNVLSLNKAM